MKNKPDAGADVAVNSLINSAPAVHTLLLAANALAVHASLFEPAPHDLDRELTPVALAGRVPLVFATSESSAIKTLPELVAAAKASPAVVTVAIPGNGATPHLAQFSCSGFEARVGCGFVVERCGGKGDCIAGSPRPARGGGGMPLLGPTDQFEKLLKTGTNHRAETRKGRTTLAHSMEKT